MRAPGLPKKDETKLELLAKAETGANYSQRLNVLIKRTKQTAGPQGITLEVSCPWRVRVGGHRGPESMLLPAFDALGMPYIPSSTLRGVARDRGVRELMNEENLTWSEAQKTITSYFGSLEGPESNRMGKVIFLDAYPLPGPENRGGLRGDMANNIWKWEGDALPSYKPNPNVFLSLYQPTFVVGIRPGPSCTPEILQKVKAWLVAGLQQGIGSQVNTGYGSLIEKEKRGAPGFLAVPFSLEGQLIHGRHHPGSGGRGEPEVEVRPVAFKSMLRYWFRALALGVLPVGEVKTWEAKLFGAIEPQCRGWVRVEVRDTDEDLKKDPKALKSQSGTLVLSCSPEIPAQDRDQVIKLFKHLTWLMFHLGGIGQGARRPCYDRCGRRHAPWWRGSSLIPETEESFWELPEELGEFQELLRKQLTRFYQALGSVTGNQISYQSPRVVKSSQGWSEAIDGNCRILVTQGPGRSDKPYALAVLHSPELKRQGKYDGQLCGQVAPQVVPSPVWITNLGEGDEAYQVVTVFGAHQDPRKKYLKQLQDDGGKVCPVWPFPRQPHGL